MGTRDSTIDTGCFVALADRHSAAYTAAKPFPHTCIDDFLFPSAAQAIADSIPEPGKDRKWDFYFAKGFEEKWAISDYLSLPAPAREFVNEFNSGPFIRFLEKLTGIAHLLPDPHLHGGGIHLVKRGGVLQVHSDFNWSEQLAAHRRVNVFVYFNPGWQQDWKGSLELWDAQGQACMASYLPLFNRLVVFTARTPFTGTPRRSSVPRACGASRSRCTTTRRSVPTRKNAIPTARCTRACTSEAGESRRRGCVQRPRPRDMMTAITGMSAARCNSSMT